LKTVLWENPVMRLSEALTNFAPQPLQPLPKAARPHAAHAKRGKKMVTPCSFFFTGFPFFFHWPNPAHRWSPPNEAAANMSTRAL
jgi:hypothetical protein